MPKLDWAKDVLRQKSSNGLRWAHHHSRLMSACDSLCRVSFLCRVRPRGFYPVWTRFSGEKSVTTHTFTDSTHGVWSVWKWETTNARLLSECLRKGVGEMKKKAHSRTAGMGATRHAALRRWLFLLLCDPGTIRFKSVYMRACSLCE